VKNHQTAEGASCVALVPREQTHLKRPALEHRADRLRGERGEDDVEKSSGRLQVVA
jgi:hypothetical protein